MNFCFHVIRELMFFQAFIDQNKFEKKKFAKKLISTSLAREDSKINYIT